jgi:tubulin-folding cofactor B
MASVLTLHVACEASGVHAEKRFDKGLTILALKGKLELVVGIPAAAMRLELRAADRSLLCHLANDDAMLGSYPAEDFMTLQVLPHRVFLKRYQGDGELKGTPCGRVLVGG